MCMLQYQDGISYFTRQVLPMKDVCVYLSDTWIIAVFHLLDSFGHWIFSV